MTTNTFATPDAGFDGSARDLIDALDQAIHDSLGEDPAHLLSMPADDLSDADALVELLGQADDGALFEAADWLASAGL